MALAPLLIERRGTRPGDLNFSSVAYWIIAAMLLLGYLTPIASTVSLVLAIVTIGGSNGFTAVQAGVFMLDAGALALIGPGAYSLDGRWFGRRILRIAKP